MFSGLGFGELFFTAGAVVIVFGTKDAPKVARGIGNLTGQAMGQICAFREEVERLVRRSNMQALHEELRRGVLDLTDLTDEIRQGLESRATGRMTSGRGSSNREQGKYFSHPPRLSQNEWKSASISPALGLPARPCFMQLPFSAIDHTPSAQGGQVGADLLSGVVTEAETAWSAKTLLGSTVESI